MSEAVTAKELALNPNVQREREILVTEREFSMVQRRAKMLSQSSIVPKDYQGNIPNCVIALEMAQRLNAGELEIMQNLHIIHGRPSFSAAYLIAQVNKSGILKGRLKFRMTGEKGKDNYGCIAYGIDRETEEELASTEITIAMAKAEGWATKNGSKWKTMPEQMLQYRAASFWSRVYAPDATMGMHTTDEVRDMPEREVQGEVVSFSSLSDVLKKDASKAPKPKEEVVEVSHPEEAIIESEPTPEPEPESKLTDEMQAQATAQDYAAAKGE